MTRRISTTAAVLSEVGRTVRLVSELPIVVIQPVLQMSAATAVKIASGKAYVLGGVVREVGTGRLVELLSDAPDLGQAAEEAARSLKKVRLPKLDLAKFETTKVDAKAVLAAGSVLLVAGAAVGGYKWVTSRRKESSTPEPAEQTVAAMVNQTVDDPACLVAFRAALKAYVDAGRTGSLTPDIIGNLVADLDAVQTYADDGNAIIFTLEELLPFFGLVAAHTPVLAAAFHVELDDMDGTDDDVVVSLRRHLETQKAILGSAA